MINIMLVAANPVDTAPLRLEEEARILEERLDNSALRGKYTLKKLSATRIRDLRQKMLDFKPQIVHFTGHGTPDGLVFQNDKGETQIVGVKAIGNLFEFFKDYVKCVTLNACYTENTAKAINEHIPSVVGMCQPITDQAAIEFTTGFYDALGAGESYERAFKFGCNSIELEGLNENETPVFFFNERISNTDSENKMKKSSDDPVEIFFSYSHEDEELKNGLITHLKALQRENLIKPWSDRDIDLSDEWKQEIDTKLNTADIILLLVSPDFIASDYCYDIEVKRAMERHDAGEARVIPIILRPTDYSNLPFAKLRAAPTNAEPVTNWNDPDSAFLNITQGIRRLIANMRGQK